MKTCPQCHQSFPDDLSFCLSDGSPLTNPSEVVTVVTPRAVPRSKLSTVVIALLAGLLALSLGITAAVLYFLWPRRSETPANQVVVANSNRPIETPTPTATPLPSPSATVTPTRSPRPTDTPDPDDEPVGSDPGPARISFAPGRASATVNGEVWRERTYLLYASEGQRLNARINSPDECAAFSNGSRTLGFSTSTGNNPLTVINECDHATSFSLTVSIR